MREESGPTTHFTREATGSERLRGSAAGSIYAGADRGDQNLCQLTPGLQFSGGQQVPPTRGGRAEVHMPGSPCCLALALCSEEMPATTPLQLLQPGPPSSPLSVPAAVMRVAISIQRPATSCQQTKQPPVRQRWRRLRSMEDRLFPCSSLTLSPGTVFTEMPDGCC